MEKINVANSLVLASKMFWENNGDVENKQSQNPFLSLIVNLDPRVNFVPLQIVLPNLRFQGFSSCDNPFFNTTFWIVCRKVLYT